MSEVSRCAVATAPSYPAALGIFQLLFTSSNPAKGRVVVGWWGTRERGGGGEGEVWLKIVLLFVELEDPKTEHELINERTNERTHARTHERTNARTNERTNEREREGERERGMSEVSRCAVATTPSYPAALGIFQLLFTSSNPAKGRVVVGWWGTRERGRERESFA